VVFKALLILAGVLCLGAGAAHAAPLPELVLNDTNEPPFTTPQRTGFLDVVAGEAFRRAGVKLRLVKLPAERALLNVNAGIEDGELCRIAGLEQQYPNLVRVPEKLVDWTFAAFGADASIPGRWDAIRQRAVGHIRGWKIYERELVGAPEVVTVVDAIQLFRLLDLGRIEVALYGREAGDALIRSLHLEGVHALHPALAKREMFIYLHKRHAALVPKLAEALRAIKAEGRYDRLYREKVLAVMATEP
jgi:polar amino acid transport system substrate-binding protein